MTLGTIFTSIGKHAGKLAGLAKDTGKATGAFAQKLKTMWGAWDTMPLLKRVPHVFKKAWAISGDRNQLLLKNAGKTLAVGTTGFAVAKAMSPSAKASGTPAYPPNVWPNYPYLS